MTADRRAALIRGALIFCTFFVLGWIYRGMA